MRSQIACTPARLGLEAPRGLPAGIVCDARVCSSLLLVLLVLAGCSTRGSFSAPVPEVTITAATTGAVTEGEELLFMVQAAPAPAAELTVSVALAETGAMLAGPASRTLTISAGSEQATLTVATNADAVDEADSTVTATVTGGTGYTLGSATSASVTVSDDDEPLPVPEVTITAAMTGAVTEGEELLFMVQAAPAPAAELTVSVALAETGAMLAGPASRTLTISVGSEQATLTVATSADAVDEADSTVTATVTRGTGYTLGSATSASVTVSDDDEPPSVPEVTITAATTGAVTEGEELLFMVQAAPAPAAELTVSVALAETGAMLAGPASRTLTISVGSEQATLTVATSADAVDEADSTVTATVTRGTGYTLGSATSASVTVSDDDEPPSVPEVTITAATTGAVTEGEELLFMVQAAPAPAAELTVSVALAETGAMLAGPVSRTLTISAGGEQATLTVATSVDAVDEADSTVTATVTRGIGYELGSATAASVTVSDDDEPPPQPPQPPGPFAIVSPPPRATVILSRWDATTCTGTWSVSVTSGWEIIGGSTVGAALHHEDAREPAPGEPWRLAYYYSVSGRAIGCSGEQCTASASSSVVLQCT